MGLIVPEGEEYITTMVGQHISRLAWASGAARQSWSLEKEAESSHSIKYEQKANNTIVMTTDF